MYILFSSSLLYSTVNDFIFMVVLILNFIFTINCIHLESLRYVVYKLI